MIALHFPEKGIFIILLPLAGNIKREMYMPQGESFVIRIRGEGLPVLPPQPKKKEKTTTSSSAKPNFSSMKLFDRFRKILMRFIFSLPPSTHRSSSSSSSSGMTAAGGSVSRTKTMPYNDRAPVEPPKTSCSSYYSSNSHYSEAIADCIEFFNKSSQEGILDGRKSDVVV